jgi:hypothetical protein
MYQNKIVLRHPFMVNSVAKYTKHETKFIMKEPTNFHFTLQLRFSENTQ